MWKMKKWSVLPLYFSTTVKFGDSKRSRLKECIISEKILHHVGKMVGCFIMHHGGKMVTYFNRELICLASQRNCVVLKCIYKIFI